MVSLKFIASFAMLPVAFVLGSAVGEEKPAPPGCHWESIPELKMHLAVPDDWDLEQVRSSTGLAYEARPTADGLSTRYRLEVEIGFDNATALERARAFVETPLQSGAQADPLEEQQKGVMTAYSTVVYYGPGAIGASAVAVAYIGLGNSRTGTVYRFRLEVPEDEVDKVLPAANYLLQNIRVDDEI